MSEERDRLFRDISRLKAERGAVIVAHNYQPAEVQDIADFVGDSLELSRKAAALGRADHRLLRRPLHGRDRRDPGPGKDRPPPGPGGGLPHGRYDHGGRAPGLEGEVSRPAGRLLRQHLGRGQGRIRHLLHVRPTRRRSSIRFPARRGPLRPGQEPGRLGRPPDRDGRSSPGTDIATSITVSGPRISGRRRPSIRTPRSGPTRSAPSRSSTSPTRSCPRGAWSGKPGRRSCREVILATEAGIIHRLKKENPAVEYFPAREMAFCVEHEEDHPGQGPEVPRNGDPSDHGPRRHGRPGRGAIVKMLEI